MQHLNQMQRNQLSLLCFPECYRRTNISDGNEKYWVQYTLSGNCHNLQGLRSEEVKSICAWADPEDDQSPVKNTRDEGARMKRFLYLSNHDFPALLSKVRTVLHNRGTQPSSSNSTSRHQRFRPQTDKSCLPSTI